MEQSNKKPVVMLYEDEGHQNLIIQRVKQCLIASNQDEQAKEFEKKAKSIKWPHDKTDKEYQLCYDNLINLMFEYVEVTVVKRKGKGLKDQ